MLTSIAWGPQPTCPGRPDAVAGEGYANLVGAEEMPVFGALGLTTPVRVTMLSPTFTMMSPTFTMLGADKATKKIIAYAADGYALTTPPDQPGE